MTQKATKGNNVRVHYTGRLDDGQVFDSSEGREPLEFTVGSGQVIPGFDAAVDGLEVGESRTVRLESDQAYGDRQDDLVVGVPREQAPEGLEPGTAVMVGNQRAVVVAVKDDVVVIDANHPLAGQALTFDLELVGIS